MIAEEGEFGQNVSRAKGLSTVYQAHILFLGLSGHQQNEIRSSNQGDGRNGC